MIKLYRYFMPRKDIFASISDLNFNSSYDIERFRDILPRNYDSQYIRRRIETEKKMYDLFKAKGGSPEKRHPYYLTLGCCNEWFFEKKHFFGSVVFDLKEFDEKTLSFTYGDSIPTFMDRFYDGKEYRHNIYTLKEIRGIIQKYGYPQQWNPLAEHGPENYIEVQVWSERPLIAYRPCFYAKSSELEELVPLLSIRMMKAKNISRTGQRDYCECIKTAKSSPWWDWFCAKIKQTNPKVFQANVIHGISHSYKCALMAFVLASFQRLDEIDTKTLVLAALYHDIGRSYYDNGRSHGQIGADIVVQYIDSNEHIHWEKLIHAIRFHDAAEIFSQDKTLRNLKDVDTLDYLRLGFGEYNPEFLREEESKKLILFSLELNIYTFIDANMILKLVNEE